MPKEKVTAYSRLEEWDFTPSSYLTQMKGLI